MYLQYNNIISEAFHYAFSLYSLWNYYFISSSQMKKDMDRRAKQNRAQYQLTGARFFNPRIFFYNMLILVSYIIGY